MRFRRLAVTTIAATFVLIAVGGLVRATDSGLGCPDWPRCFGRLVPPAELHAWIEHSHRLVASVVMVLVAWLVVAAWRTGQDKVVRRAAVAALVMVLAQALIGAFVVWWKLRADSVTLHLATALALVALLICIGFRARWPSGRADGSNVRAADLPRANSAIMSAAVTPNKSPSGSPSTPRSAPGTWRSTRASRSRRAASSVDSDAARGPAKWDRS